VRASHAFAPRPPQCDSFHILEVCKICHLSPRDAQPPIYALKAEFFRVLGHPVRIRLLQLLRDEERSVGALQVALALDSGGTSQHLAALRKQGSSRAGARGRASSTA
jgi:Helix-turn-helix domain